MVQKIATVVVAGALLLTTPVVADCYRADADSGELLFSGQVEGNPFQGRFREFEVRLCLDARDLTSARIEVTVATASATVGNRQGDEALQEPQLLHVDEFPAAVWTSRRIARAEGRYLAEGELRLRGVAASQPVDMNLEIDDSGLRLVGGAEVLRLDYHVGTGEFEDTDFIGNNIKLEFDLDLELLP